MTAKKKRFGWTGIMFLLIPLAAAGVRGDPPGGDEPVDHEVSLTSIEFHPSRLRVSVGDTIRFTNRDAFEHDVYLVRTANSNDVLVPATTIPPGESRVVKIEDEGLFSLYCTIHGGMSGMITTTGTFELTEEERLRAASLKVLPPIVKTGEELFWGRAQCHQCHRMGERGEGTRGPNLAMIGMRANVQAEKLGLGSGTEYILQSVLEPSAYIVEGYTNDMAIVYQPPIDLGEEEIRAIVAYLQSQGGEVDTWAIQVDRGLLESEPAMNPFRYGVAQHGEEVFRKMGCRSCHTIGEHRSIAAGPELTAIGAYRNWAWLAESILDPNAEVGSEWKSVMISLTSGERVSGFLRRKTEEEVEVLVRPGEIRTIAAEEIRKMRVSALTNMPSNYREMMTFQQMADLVAYLQARRGAPGENGAGGKDGDTGGKDGDAGDKRRAAKR